MGKILGVGIILVALIAAAVLIFKIISGAIGLISGLLNLILALAVIAALVAIVVWMFRFASKRK